MRQIYVESYYRSDYGRLMEYSDDVSDHPQWHASEKKVDIIKSVEDYGEQATGGLLAGVNPPSISASRS